jgi:hypothetical protein
MSNLTDNIWAICSTFQTELNPFYQLHKQSRDKRLIADWITIGDMAATDDLNIAAQCRPIGMITHFQ